MSETERVGADRNMVRRDHPTEANRIEVYVLDDHRAALAALVDHVNRAPGCTVVGASSSAATAIDEITVLLPLVAVIDGHLGDRDGLDVCRALQRVAPGVECVIVTAGVQTAWSGDELSEAGVAAVVLKQLRHFPLVEVILDVAAHQVDRFDR
jgi:DNA-binding NarL/FixJ family response regulator